MDAEETWGLLGDGRKPCCCTRLFRSIRQSKKTAVVVMFLAFMLDLMLLTVVEPLLPDILRSATLASVNQAVNASVPQHDRHGNLSRMPYLPAPEDDSVNPVLLGILNGAKPLTQVVLNPIIGCIVDRSGHTVPILVGFIVAFCSTVGFAYFNTYGLLIGTRCLQGLGSSLMTVAGLTMLSTVYRDPEERGRAMTVAFSGLAFGLIVGFPLGSFLYQFAGRQAPFICLAVLILLGAIIRFGLMPVKLGSKDDPEQAGAGGLCDGLSIFLDAYILAAAGVYFWLCYAIGTVMGIGPLYLQEQLGAEQWQIGVIFLVGAVAQNISQYAMAVWSFRLGWWLCALVGLITVAIGMGVYPLVKTLWLILAPQVVYGAGIGVKSTQLSVTIILLVSPFHFGLTVFKFIARPEPSIKGYSRLSVVSHFTSGLVMGSIPPLLGHLADIRVNSQYGAVFALSDTGTNLGYFLGSTITGILVDNFSYLISFASMAAVIVLFALVTPVLRNVPEKHPPISAAEKRAILHQSWRRASRHSISLSLGLSQSQA